MGEVANALDALEKTLAKGSRHPSPARRPLRRRSWSRARAVEIAGEKGEDVATIRVELDAIEKVVAGKRVRATSPCRCRSIRPAGPNFNRRGGLSSRAAGGGNVVIRGGGNVVIQNMQIGGRGGNAMSITLTGNEFTIKATQEGVQYVIQGAIGEENTILDKVTITDGEKKPVEVKSLKDVPKEYQPAVERLLKSIGR